MIEDIKNINHDIFLESNKVLKNINNIHDDIILIVPISSTFTTSVKIFNQLKKLKISKGQPSIINYLNRDLNVILVADETSDVFCNKETENKFDYSIFNWEDVRPEKRLLKVKDREQVFFYTSKNKKSSCS